MTNKTAASRSVIPLLYQKPLSIVEVLFVNERGELAEGSRTNIFLARAGRLLTPALTCGLLPGTFRQRLIETGEAEEAILRPADLATADRVYLGNSVRGLVPAVPIDRKTRPRPGRDVDYTRPITGGPTARGFDWYFGISASLNMPQPTPLASWSTPNSRPL